MKIHQLALEPFRVVEIISDEVFITKTQDVLDLMGNEPADRYVFHTHNFEADFFDLSTGKLGQIMQKFANYRICVAIVGDFAKYPSKTLKEYILESNKFGENLFVSSLDEVKNRWQLPGEV